MPSWNLQRLKHQLQRDGRYNATHLLALAKQYEYGSCLIPANASIALELYKDASCVTYHHNKEALQAITRMYSNYIIEGKVNLAYPNVKEWIGKAAHAGVHDAQEIQAMCYEADEIC